MYLVEMQLNERGLLKRLSTILILIGGLSLLESRAQAPAPATTRPDIVPGAPANAAPDDLSCFDLDFKGGPPQQLVAEIEKVGVLINVIIPDGAHSVMIPPLKMRNVTLPQLFQATEVVSQNVTPTKEGTGSPYMMELDERE